MRRSRLLRLCLLGALTLSACRGAKESAPAASAAPATDLTGAGATFPYPIFSRWFSAYAVKTGVHINYQSIGSGGGIRQMIEGLVDFGASEAPLTDDDIAHVRNGRLLQVPMLIGGVVVVYNLPELHKPLHLSPEVVAGIYLGRIRRWNAPEIAALNPGAPLPDADILVTHRSDGSGTTYVFTDWLSRTDAAWAKGPGHARDVKWPIGVGAKGNEGVAGQVKATEHSIGVVELAYAAQNRLAVAALRNRAGQFISPSPAAFLAAAQGVESRLPAPDDFRVALVDAPGRDAYPLASFSWLLLYQRQPDDAKGRALGAFVRWALRTGQADVGALLYAPLPPALVTRIEAALDRAGIAGP